MYVKTESCLLRPRIEEWRLFTNDFKSTFKLVRREKRLEDQTGLKHKPQTPYQRLLASLDIPAATKAKLQAEHAGLDPFALKKGIEVNLKKLFTALGNLNREATKP